MEYQPGVKSARNSESLLIPLWLKVVMGCALTMVAAFLYLYTAGVAFSATTPYTILDNPTGGDCTLVGTWDNGTKTCTLNQDISVSGTAGIIIGSNGLTLDGNGHTLANNDLTNPGVFMDGKSNISVKNLVVSGFYEGIEVYNASTGVIVTGNTVSGNNYGIFVFFNSSANTFSRNVITNNALDGISVAQSSNNTIYANVISNNNASGLRMTTNANNNLVYNNDFINSNQVSVSGSTGNTFNQASPVGGNYWADHATPAQGCANVDNNRFCDALYTPNTGVTDNLPLARRSYYFTWYDMASAGAQDWVLMANPIEAAGEDAWFDLSIAGVQKTLPTISQIPGQVPPLGTITPTYPGTINGPLEVGYHARMRQMVSQRTLWGDSLEEVTGTDAARLSDHFYWTWYDQQSPGFQNWVMVANPNIDTARVEITIAGQIMNNPATGNPWWDIAPGDRETPAFPGTRGGPVELKAWSQAGGPWPADPREVIASQRVLSNYGNAFNEVPGIPAAELSDHYWWTWYDSHSAGAQNWIMIANPEPVGGLSMDYSIFVHGVGIPVGVDLAPGAVATVTIPDKIDGPVEVMTVRHNSGIPLNSIVSQRVLWGPSFEEVPGLPDSLLKTKYYWTWYDQQSPGSLNWIMVANPDSGAGLHYEITVNGVDPGVSCASGDLVASGYLNCAIPGLMSGPVKVQAWNLPKTADKNVVTSQRVLWKGYFNEVWGTELS